MTNLHRRSLLAVAMLVTCGALIGGLTAAAQSPSARTGNVLAPATVAVSQTVFAPTTEVPSETPIPSATPTLPDVTYTPTPSPTVEISLTPSLTITPYPTLVTPTEFPRPTLDKTGKLLGQTEEEVQQFILNAPKTAGTFPLYADPNQGEPITPHMGFKTPDGTIRSLTFEFFSSQQDAYDVYLSMGHDLRRAYLVTVGDEALVSERGYIVLAAMRYHNVIVKIYDTSPTEPKSVPLTSDQLTAIFKDLVDYLAKQ
ncbi:MAG: hypothetical protein ABI947_20680 [Chloroflexota bacterium]